jgi:hypothetical protein
MHYISQLHDMICNTKQTKATSNWLNMRLVGSLKIYWLMCGMDFRVDLLVAWGFSHLPTPWCQEDIIFQGDSLCLSTKWDTMLPHSQLAFFASLQSKEELFPKVSPHLMLAKIHSYDYFYQLLSRRWTNPSWASSGQLLAYSEEQKCRSEGWIPEKTSVSNKTAEHIYGTPLPKSTMVMYLGLNVLTIFLQIYSLTSRLIEKKWIAKPNFCIYIHLVIIIICFVV